MARKVLDTKVNPLGILDVVILRNAYGRQIHSTTEELTFFEDGNSFSCPTTMIRAPRIDSIGSSTEVLGYWKGHPVAVREDRHIGLVFHPELDGVTHFHQLAFQEKKNIQQGSKNREYAT